MKNLLMILALAGTGVVAAACATTPRETPYLARAEQAYLEARSDPAVAKYAPVPMHEAGEAIEKAREVDDNAERRHYAYLAEKKIELAKTLALRESAEDQMEKLRAEQDDLLIRVRGEEAEKARRQAKEAQAELHAYRSEQQEKELLDARGELRRLKQEIADMEARETEQGLLLTFGSVLFAVDRSELKPGAELSMQKLADFLRKYPGRKIVVEGHTDNTGSEEYNQELSERRARAVAPALRAAGVDPARMNVRGMGEDYPIAPNTTAAGRQQNRRVEVLVMNEGA
jgi:outer membrane protein OmpA-like peptidoglycan-associated protein